ncbi:MAG: WecB/TagA/CpsF family glycosyltransferase [Gemmatimonas sp.]
MARLFGAHGNGTLRRDADGRAGLRSIVGADPGSETVSRSDETDRDGGTIRLFGLPLTCTPSIDDAVRMVRDGVIRRPAAALLVTFANPLAVGLFNADPSYRSDLRRMGAVFCDGIALAWAVRRLAGYPMARVSFDSTGMAPSVFALAERHGRRVALIGGRRGVAQAASRQLRDRFPRLDIVATIDGYGKLDRHLRTILAVDPDLLVCGMGAPRQEEFLATLANAGWCGTGFTCGGYLDHLVGGFDFYPETIDRLNLRWLYRMSREPKRIGYRCTVEYAPFWKALAAALVSRALIAQRRNGQS